MRQLMTSVVVTLAVLATAAWGGYVDDTNAVPSPEYAFTARLTACRSADLVC